MDYVDVPSFEAAGPGAGQRAAAGEREVACEYAHSSVEGKRGEFSTAYQNFPFQKGPGRRTVARKTCYFCQLTLMHAVLNLNLIRNSPLVD